jgi:uptake hydrogenase large subunit
MRAIDLAGELAVQVEVGDARVTAVHIDSTRPQLAGKLLAGKAAVEAVALVPQLFSICGRAQHSAAELALAAARGMTGPVAAERIRRIEAEMAQEYLWRALIDWSRAVGETPDTKTVAAARSALAHDDRDLLRVIVERDVLGADACDWYEREHVPAFEIWIARGATATARFLAEVQREGPRHGASPVPLLPAFDDDVARRIAAALDADPDFERRPHFGGHPAETGAVARLRGQSLVAALADVFGYSTLVRFAARLSELARLACEDPAPVPLAGSVVLGAGRGLGWVETARGLLLHQIDLDGERIARYRIVAPTEWNFHPDGPLAAAMLGVHELAAADLERRTEWLLQSLDPCVAYRLELRHA